MNYALLTTVVLVLLCLDVFLFIICLFYRWVRRVSVAADRRLKASREERGRRREEEEEWRARKAQERKDNRTDGDPSQDKNGCLGCPPFSLVFLAGIVFAVVVIFGIRSGLGFEIAIGIFSMPFG